MTKRKLYEKYISVCVLYLLTISSSFTVATTREKSAHFCRCSCAFDNIK